ncbi:unnamed protein product [Phytophthora fragariaefolia]|uniref:Unnamed protein product n=1 Tax=Phytophthora fragariaefolia TaxID=1490495 RepID=A0A9W6XE38_9STRA|nr:unnamed protein product [Phytophthora fragariaefolia]
MAATPPPYASFVQPNADTEFPAEKDCYHLYVSYACPFASRALSACYLTGLEDVVGLSVAHPIHQKTKPDDDSDTHRSWYFVDPSTTLTVTGVNGRDISQVLSAYFLGQQEEDDRVRRLGGHPADAQLGLPGGRAVRREYTAQELESEVEAANNGIVMEISGPYFKAAFAHDAESSQVELAKVFAGVA